MRPFSGSIGIEAGEVAFFAEATHDDFVFAGHHRNEGGHGHIAHRGEHACLMVDLKQAIVFGDGVFAVLRWQGSHCKQLLPWVHFAGRFLRFWVYVAICVFVSPTAGGHENHGDIK